MPQEAERITAGNASSMRVASSGAAKPPKTTEWMAPMRAQASMPISASGSIGRYRITRSPRLTPRSCSISDAACTASSSSPKLMRRVLPVTGLS